MKKKDRKTQKRQKLLVDAVNTSLKPIEKSYDFFLGAIQKGKERFPWLYDHIESILRQHIVTVKEEERKNPDIQQTLTKNILNRLPSVDEAHFQNLLIEEKNSFLDILTKGFEPAKRGMDYTTVSREKLFKRVLIANRGEIALRIIRACRELGIYTVVLYSKDEKDSLHVKFADASCPIGNPRNYLNVKKILALASTMKVDAIHPGYGFLSENSLFPQLCRKHKIKFIGPTQRTLDLLANKIMAKRMMKKEGIPVLNGPLHSLEGERQAKMIAGKLGYPIILKAASGGGGKGMRVVHSDAEMSLAFQNAFSEAKQSFDDGTLYMEKYIEDAKHVEFQVLADNQGNVIHLGERDCSIQRRHQKLIEEAPSPALNHDLREEMGTAAVKAIRTLGYQGAGTVEFLLDKNNNFYFIEMNTRIQVEHGITELVARVDLVKEQLKLAAGARLSIKQEDVTLEGCAIECRINAEDPTQNFLPSPGVITNYLPPGGPGIKISSTCHTGYEVKPHFDSLLSLLMCAGKTREEALKRMERALDEYIIEGVRTTIPFHNSVFSHKAFLKGEATTNFIKHHKILTLLKKKRKTAQKSLTKETKTLLVTVAAARYSSNRMNAHPGDWDKAARQDQFDETF